MMAAIAALSGQEYGRRVRHPGSGPAGARVGGRAVPPDAPERPGPSRNPPRCRPGETAGSHGRGYGSRRASFILRVWVPDRPGALGRGGQPHRGRPRRPGRDRHSRAGRRVGPSTSWWSSSPTSPSWACSSPRSRRSTASTSRTCGRPPAGAVDPRLDALETAASLVAHAEVGSLLDALARRSLSDFQSDWAAVVDLDSSDPVVDRGPGPAGGLAGGVRDRQPGVRRSGRRAAAPTTWPGPTWTRPGWCVVLGRKGRPFRARERRQLTALARIVDHRWAELHTRSGRMAHPSALSF